MAVGIACIYGWRSMVHLRGKGVAKSGTERYLSVHLCIFDSNCQINI